MNVSADSSCQYSVVRYVPDPVRNEPRNIGVLVLCPERSFAAGRFSLGGTGLSPTSPRYRFLRSIIDSYRLSVTGAGGADFDARAEPGFDLAYLRRLHDESTNIIQFTEALPAPGEPEQVLADVYRDFVARRHAGGSGWNRSSALQLFRRAFRKHGLESWIKDLAVIRPKGEPPYVFDFGVGNGSWRALIANASFRTRDVQKPEERAAWMTYAIRAIRPETDAEAFLFVERASNPESEKRYERIQRWLQGYEIGVFDASAAQDVASDLVGQFARELSGQHVLIS
jgi:hypothetical protein